MSLHIGALGWSSRLILGTASFGVSRLATTTTLWVLNVYDSTKKHQTHALLRTHRADVLQLVGRVAGARPRISAWQAKVRLARSALPRTSVTRARLPIHLVGVPRSVELAVGARPMVSVLQATLRLQVARSALLRANVSRVIAPLAHSKDWSGSNLQALSMGNAWRMTKTVTSVLSPPHLQLVEVVQ